MTIDTATAEWLRSDADHTLRYEPMLKAMFLRQAPPDERRAIAKAYLAFAEEQLAKLRQIDAKRRTERAADARRLAILFYEAVENWARETAAK
jgi:hypothetical protein